MPSLTLLRRHRPACKAKHPIDSYNTEAEERRHNWKRCNCKIYAHGTLNGVFKKLATKARDWERAQEVIAPYLAAGSWDVPQSEPPPPTAPAPGQGVTHTPDPESGIRIADAIQAFLEDHASSQSAAGTIRRYTGVLGQFERFSAQLGLGWIDQWKRPHVRQLVVGWKKNGNSQLTAQKKLNVLKPFFEPYVEDGVLTENPARIKIEHPNRAARAGTDSQQKDPFSDEELARMLAGCSRLVPSGRWPHKQVVAIIDYRRPLTGEDLADFIEVSVYTGLRISDVATFHIRRLTAAGEVNLRATKNGKWVSVWIPEWLRHTIQARAARVGPYIFGQYPEGTDINAITDRWRNRLYVLWRQTGPWPQAPTHHRFRHTFVRILLQRHVPVAVIADLVGDTEIMIRKHYAAWNLERQESTSRILAEAFRDVPRFHRR